MAKESTSSSDSIRASVCNHLNEARQSNTIADIKGLSTQNSMRYVNAAAAFDRASRDKNFKPNAEQTKDFIRLTDAVAKKIGIEKNDKGFYDEKYFKKELSPKNLMNIYAAQSINSEIAKVDANDADARAHAETEARKNISKTLNDVYEGQQVPEEVAAVKDVDLDQTESASSQENSAPSNPTMLSNKTVEEIEKMNSDDREEYLAQLSNADPVEYKRVQDELEKRAQQRQEELEKNAGRFERMNDDPDWGHKKDDDDFKIEQGDIIEYLMKDVILASAAWVGNKTAGFAGIVIYETGDAIAGGIKKGSKWTWNKTKDFWKNTTKKLFGYDKDDDEQTKKAKDKKQEIFNEISKCYSDQIDDSEGRVTKLHEEDEKTDAYKKLMRQLCRHNVILGEDSITFPYIEDEGVKTPLVKQPYKTFHDNPEEFKQQLNDAQKNFDEYQIAVMEEQLKKSGVNTTNEEVRQWFTDYTKYIENEGVRKNNPNPKIPEKLNKPNFVNAYKQAQKACLVQLKFQPERCILEEQTKQFAAHYAFYQYLEMLRLEPNNPILQNKEKLIALFNEKQKEATYIFLSNEIARLKGKDVPSREELINMSKNMVNASNEAIKNGINTPVEDKVKNVLTLPHTEKEKKMVDDFIWNISAEQLLQLQKADSDQRIKEIEASQMDNNAKRDNIDKIKQQVGMTQNKKTELETKGFNLKDAKMYAGKEK